MQPRPVVRSNALLALTASLALAAAFYSPTTAPDRAGRASATADEPGT